MKHEKLSPAAAGGLLRDPQVRVAFETDDGPRSILLSGRSLWALRQLRRTGPDGFTSLDCPALRLAAYVHDLRKLGLDIETVREPHGGDFPSWHGRYILHTPVRIGGAA